MGRLALTLLALLAACAKEEPAPAPPSGVEVRAFGFSMRIPEAWTKDVIPLPQQVLWFGPEVDGFKPSVQIAAQTWTKSLEGWYSAKRDGIDRRDEILSERGTEIAGVPAREVVYRTTHTDRGTGKTSRLILMDVYFVVPGRACFFRGLSIESRWEELRPLFDAAARSLKLA